MVKKIESLYEWIQDNEMAKELIEVINSFDVNQDPNPTQEKAKNNFVFLFSYDFFHMTHMCLCDILSSSGKKEKDAGFLENIQGLQDCLEAFDKI
jgi:hypothetical protein